MGQGRVLLRQAQTPLLASYFERRDDLRRFYIARLGSPTEADDLVQELYLKAAQAEPADIRNPAAYLYRLASNVMLDRLRHQRRSAIRDRDWRRSHHVITPGEDAADLPDAEQAIAARQRLDRLVAALKDLPPQTQRVFRLHKFDGLSHSEVAAQLGISRSAVEKHVMAALRHLLMKLGPQV